jgi:hypothetical protein
MHRLLNRWHRDERGMTYVFVGMGFMAFMAATTLAIDVGMFMTARSQAQNSADAGALGGAVALAFEDYGDRSVSGPAVQTALSAGLANQVVGREVSLTPADVEFLLSPEGLDNRVRVTVRRSTERGNAVPTLMGRFFGVQSADITATATAEASPANAMTCVKPFTIPDRWTERQTPPWDASDTFDMYDNQNRLLANPDIYVPSTEPGYTGYDAQRDKGLQLMIRAGTGNNIQPSFYFSYSIGGVTGGSAYDWNIGNCNTTVMGFGDLLLMEPGNMVGPTTQGVDDLIARDPNAYWNTALNKVMSSMNPSPRVAIIPVFDPVHYATGKANGRNADLKVANYIGFFIESKSGNNVYGRITPVAGIYRGSNGQAPINAFPKAIRLVE